VTPKAAEAFRDFVSLDPQHSVAKHLELEADPEFPALTMSDDKRELERLEALIQKTLTQPDFPSQIGRTD
jgi:hypothetical protein